jgi:hypothetical protein
MSTGSPKTSGVDRREFMLGAGIATVALSPLAIGVRSALARGRAEVANVAAADWSIDDMWTGYPRHAEPIGYARPHAAPELAALVDPIDLPFLA